MKSLIVLLISLSSFSGLISQNLPRFSNIDVFELEYASDPQISPDGNSIVYVRSGFDIMKDRSMGRLWFIESNGQGHRKLTSNDTNESSPRWSPDGSRIAFVSSTEAGSEIFVHWINTGVTARLTHLEKSPQGIAWSPDGQFIAFSMTVPALPVVMVKAPSKPQGAQWADHPRVTTRLRHEADGVGYLEPGFSHLFIISSEGGSARQITTGDFNHSSPVWSRDGKSLLFTSNRNDEWEYDFRNSEIYSVQIANGVVKQMTDRTGPDHSPSVSPDGKTIAYLSYEDKVQTYQVNHIWLMNPDGSGKKQITTSLDRNISDISWNATGTGLYFRYDNYGDGKVGLVTLDGRVSTVAEKIGGTSMGRPYGSGAHSVSSTGNIAFTFSQPDRPADLAVIRDGQVAVLTSLNADILDHRQLGSVEELWYKSSFDGRQIQGWIVKPAGFKPGTQYPLLVENHGGPIANYGAHFSAEIQLFAAAGYVVFYPNPRGSTSYGEEFGNLLYHNYPGNDYDDVMSGVDAVLQKGYIDESRMFVTGGSAGGIMTAWIIGKNNRFRAAAVVKPVMNWVSKTLVADNYFGYSHSRFPGWTWENFEGYMKFSPISLVGNVETPTLVMVGMNDLRTPPSEAKQLYHALKLRKIQTALVEIPGSYHNIAARPSQLITKVDHILAWFEKYR